MGSRLGFVVGIVLLIAGCASGGSGRSFAEMTPEEHMRAAEREHRLADDEFQKVDPDGISPGNVPGESGPIFYSPFDPSFDPVEAEYYTIDPRVHDPSEKHEDRARKHRERAERHEAAAAQGRRVR